MNVVAVIPIHGRIPLVKYTIQRLLNKNQCSTVICVGETDEEREVVESSGGVFVFHKNNPLGAKWNYGFYYAKRFNPDAVLFMGSSDWVSDNWVSTCYKFIEDGGDMIGTRDFCMLDISNEVRTCRWMGYPKDSERYNEPIGIGRLLSKRFLDNIEWTPFQHEKNNSMDYSMILKLWKICGEVIILDSNYHNIVSLSISTNKWGNMHKFEDHWNDKVKSKTRKIKGVNQKELLNKFPEYEFFLSDLQKI